MLMSGTVEAKKMTIFPNYFDVITGTGSMKCKVKNLPKNATVTWKSSNKKIAKVGKKTGLVVAGKKQGKCMIIATVERRGKNGGRIDDIVATCISHKLTVLPPG